MNELIKITYNNDRPAVSARDLHDFLEVKTAYKDWFPRMCEYGFTEGEDFNPLKIERVQNEGERIVARTVDDAVLTIDMAKELCMIQRNEKGKQARQYDRHVVFRRYRRCGDRAQRLRLHDGARRHRRVRCVQGAV